LSGQSFRGIQIISVSHVDQRHEYYYNVRCHCGRLHVFATSTLKNPRVKGCGCGNNAVMHGKVNTPEYRTWAAMKARCFNPAVVAYPDYGGRGITVCGHWLDFKNFYADMGPKPSARHTIERRNNNGDYEPDNCCWATPGAQARNRRSNILLTVNSETMTAKDWAVRLSIKSATIYRRLAKGWTIEKTLTTPVRLHRLSKHTKAH
jgi:hypothetical protein